jgi:hypothetical protein
LWALKENRHKTYIPVANLLIQILPVFIFSLLKKLLTFLPLDIFTGIGGKRRKRKISKKKTSK